MKTAAKKTNRVPVTTSIDKDLYKRIKFIALEKDKNVNDIIEEGIEYIIQKHKK